MKFTLFGNSKFLSDLISLSSPNSLFDRENPKGIKICYSKMAEIALGVLQILEFQMVS